MCQKLCCLADSLSLPGCRAAGLRGNETSRRASSGRCRFGARIHVKFATIASLSTSNNKGFQRRTKFSSYGFNAVILHTLLLIAQHSAHHCQSRSLIAKKRPDIQVASSVLAVKQPCHRRSIGIEGRRPRQRVSQALMNLKHPFQLLDRAKKSYVYERQAQFAPA